MNHIVFYIFSFMIGLCVGSFYNVCIYRYINNISIVKPRSHCPVCKHVLSWWENIPIVSFILLKGKCKECSSPISLRYPLVEFISGMWALLLAFKFGPSILWLIFMLFGGIFIVSSFIDFEIFILPDILILPGCLIGLFVGVFFLFPDWEEPVFGALIGAGIFWLIQLIYKLVRKIEGLGTGDIKLMFLIGTLVGYKGVVAVMFLGSCSALVASIYYMKKSSEGLKTMVPFGPFLCFGAMVTILLNPIISFHSFCL